ncbi:MAG: hypothetical protein Q8P67_10815 [archaeon]|nr:hypothetical protein [archaeon]
MTDPSNPPDGSWFGSAPVLLGYASSFISSSSFFAAPSEIADLGQVTLRVGDLPFQDYIFEQYVFQKRTSLLLVICFFNLFFFLLVFKKKKFCMFTNIDSSSSKARSQSGAYFGESFLAPGDVVPAAVPQGQRAGGVRA